MRQRLLDRIREREGLSYSPSAGSYSSHWLQGFGYFTVTVDTSTSQSRHVFDVVAETITSLRNGVSQDEIERARAPLIERSHAAQQENLLWVGPLAVLQSDPKELENWLHRADAYRDVTPADIVRAARQYLQPDRAVRLLVLPEH